MKSDGLLVAAKVSKVFGGQRAVDDVSFALPHGSIGGLIGPNGAGKTTLFNCLAGYMKPTSGQVWLDGQAVAGAPPSRVFAAGLARTFQIPRPFPEMTVLENVMLAPTGQLGERFWANWLRPAAVAQQERSTRDAAMHWLDFVGLSALAPQPARVLSGGQRKLLELARVMVAEPKLVLLDEPGAGVNPALARPDRRQGGRAEPPGHQLPDHRAQHGPGDVAVPPGDGHGAGPAAGQRRARRGAARPARGRGLSGRRGMTAALSIEKLEAGYEPGLPIVRGASLTIETGEIVAIIGPNGAGKSSLVKAVAGLVPISAGRVRLGDKDITRVPAHDMVHQGLAFVPQTENVFANLTIAENLELAAALLKTPRHRRAESLEPVYTMFPDLARQRTLLAGRLSGGQRQMLAVARALIARPRVLMLDEPSAGLSPKLVGQVLQTLRTVRDGGLTVLLVEQNVKAALAVADRVAVLVEGRERIVAPAAELQRDPRIAELYLGRHAGAPAAADELH